jgi:TonB family protein
MRLISKLLTNRKILCFVCSSILISGAAAQNNLIIDGEWKSYDAEGKLMISGSYVDGKQDGEWSYFHADGSTLRSQLFFKNGVQDSVCTGYSKSGKITAQETYLNGEIQGISRTYTSSGTLASLKTYVEGEQNGLTEYYYDFDSIKISLEYKNDVPYTIHYLKDINGFNLDGGTLKDGTGSLKSYYTSSLIDADTLAILASRRTYIVEKLHGEAYDFDKDGEVIVGGQHTGGLVTGVWNFAKKKGKYVAVTDVAEIKERLYNSPPEKEATLQHHRVQESMPMFPGSEEALFMFLGRNIKYPKGMYKAKISGSVLCTFSVEKTGELTNIKVLKSIHEEASEEAIRVISGMPNWTPGFQNNLPVRVQFNFPIYFNAR